MMKRLKRFLTGQRGFTLVELVIAMTIGGLVVTAAVAIMAQLLWVTPRNTSYAAAFTQVQNAGNWISRDALMAQATSNPTSTLSEGIGSTDEVIPVNDITRFPPTGVIKIDEPGEEHDEFITYTGIDYEDNEFTGCIRGDSAPSHGEGELVTLDALVTLQWTVGREDDGEITFEQHQAIYTLEGASGELGEQKELRRSHYIYIWDEDEDVEEYVLLSQDTIRVAEFIDSTSTSSNWDDTNKELIVIITAQVGEKTATRTYGINPRPLS